ncbi:MAG: dienelactone hydrolase family protein [Muribaculaceae bacterium]|nr:dienelactone hydrolase family protein [Muribaculaceae bacterium]
MKKLLIIFLSVFTFIQAQGVLTAERGKVADAYNFWLSTPDGKTDDEKKPLVIFLHGASLCGTNLDRVRRYGTIDAIERGRDLDAYVIAPQNPGGAWKPSKIMKIVEWVETNFDDVDSERIYVLGMSLGGYGTIDFAAAYPDRVAAAIAMCGGGTSRDLANLNEVPLWIIHGTADAAVSIAQSDKVVAAMKDSDETTPRLIYDRIPGMNHSQPARMFYLKDTYDWLFSHSLADEDRPVNEAFDVNTSKLSTAYKDLRSKPGAKTTKKKTKRSKRKRRRK